jgi:Uma2 family endonuclease
MALPLLKEEIRYTFADYYSWDDGKRWELIEGVPSLMSPAPGWTHQGILGELYTQFHNFLRDKPCIAFPAPFDVRLNGAGDDDDTVVQPDIVVLCDKSKLDNKGCNGAPDIVIEILSPSTARHDMLVKFKLYQNAGVREYWIVDQDRKIVSVHLLNNDKYITHAYGDTDTIPVTVLDGLLITLPEVFAAAA